MLSQEVDRLEILTASNTGMSQLLCDIWNEVESNRSLRLSLPIPLVDRIHTVVEQQHT